MSTHPSLRIGFAGGDSVTWARKDLAAARSLALRKVWNEEGV